jgi:hypothetical protein
MVQKNLHDRKFKQTIKEALAETLQDNRDLLREILAEVVEDFALAQAIRAGRRTKPAGRDEVLGVLQGKS